MRKAIRGYTGYYEIDCDGKVYSLDRMVTGKHGKQKVRGRTLKPILHESGYFLVNLAKNGVVRTWRLHKLVALTFLSNPKRLPHINHKDLDKTNPKLQNLEWCTPQGNMNHAKLNGATAHGFKNGSCKLNAEQIVDARESIVSGELIQDVASRLNVNRNTIVKAINREHGKLWKDVLPNLKRRAANIRWNNHARDLA